MVLPSGDTATELIAGMEPADADGRSTNAGSSSCTLPEPNNAIAESSANVWFMIMAPLAREPFALQLVRGEETCPGAPREGRTKGGRTKGEQRSAHSVCAGYRRLPTS